MVTKILIPSIGQKETRGSIGVWFKKEGDEITKGEPLCTFETEKTSIEIEATASGILRIILRLRDSEVSVGDCIGIIASKEDDIREYCAKNKGEG